MQNFLKGEKVTNREREILKWIEENPFISQNEIAEKANITRSSVAVHISNLLKKGKIAGKGYILPKKSYITVVGGANIDIAGIPHGVLKDYDSNPGRVGFSLGGVGRNIAENLARLDQNVEFLTILGDDLYGEEIRRSARSLGMGISHAMTVENAHTSTYLFFLDEKRDMKVAIAAMDLYDEMSESYIDSKRAIINNSEICIVDTNIPEKILKHMAETLEVSLFVDCVSTAKTERIRNFIGKFHTVKANRLEAETLFGKEIKNDEDLKAVGEYLLQKGVKQLFISLGEEGVFFANSEKVGKIPAFRCKVVNATGAGDAFMAGIALGFTKGLDIEEVCLEGIAAATIAVSSEETISREMSLENLEKIKFENRGEQL